MTPHRITNAGPNDCVAGRGGYTNHHSGTNKFRAQVEKRKLEYLLAANNEHKQKIRDELIRNWKREGGRFLKGDQCSGFFIMTAKEEKKKTSQRLREPSDLFNRRLFRGGKNKDMMLDDPTLYDEQTLRLMQAPMAEF